MNKSAVVLGLQPLAQQLEITVILDGSYDGSLEFPSQPALLVHPSFTTASLSDENFGLSCHCKLRTTLYLNSSQCKYPFLF